MIAWIVFALMVAVAAIGIAIPLVRTYEARRDDQAPADALGQELAQIDAEVAQGALSEELAEDLKVQAKRRFLVETEGEGRSTSAGGGLAGPAMLYFALGLAALVGVGGTLLYAKIGRPDLLGGTAAATPVAADGAMPAGHGNEMVAQLEAKLKAGGGTAEEWRMLGWSLETTGRYPDAAQAFAKAASMDPKNADYPSAMGEALAKAAGGRVSPEAEAAFQSAIKLDPTDPRARYFLAAAKDQRGDHEGAMADWVALLKSAPPDAPWFTEVRDFVINLAKERGQDVAARLPPARAPVAPPDAAAQGGPSGPVASGGEPGPSAAQMAQAQNLSQDDRAAMVKGMVEKLAARLKADPSDAKGWVMLMRARQVLGDQPGAAAAYKDAMRTFNGSPAEKASIQQSAKQLGVPGA